MKEIGEVLEIGFAEGNNRYDGNKPYPHPHLICIKCKEIIDPDLATLSDITQKLEQDTGFRILNHRLDFFGICTRCQEKKQVYIGKFFWPLISSHDHRALLL